MPDLPLPKLPDGDPENLLSYDARQRIGHATVESDLMRKRALSTLETRYQAEPNGCSDFTEYLGKGQAWIDFSDSRIKAASVVLRAEAKEYGDLGLSGREFREIMERKIDEMAYSLEFSMLQRDALATEFLWGASPRAMGESGSGGSGMSTGDLPLRQKNRRSRGVTKPCAVARVQSFIDGIEGGQEKLAEKAKLDVGTIRNLLSGEEVDRRTWIKVSKAMGKSKEFLFLEQ